MTSPLSGNEKRKFSVAKYDRPNDIFDGRNQISSSSSSSSSSTQSSFQAHTREENSEQGRFSEHMYHTDTILAHDYSLQ